MVNHTMKVEASRYKVSEEDLTVYLIDDRRMTLSCYCKGNSKLGPNIYTYSKLPGRKHSCPGASDECEKLCYAKRVVDNEILWGQWNYNTLLGYNVPPIPADAYIIRLHVSGDFDTLGYIEKWRCIAEDHPEVTFYTYTRSWRVERLREAIRKLNDLPNVTIFASMDKSIGEAPPAEMRIAWMEGDERLTVRADNSMFAYGDRKALICPEETGRRKNCQECGYCFREAVGDVVFLEH